MADAAGGMIATGSELAIEAFRGAGDFSTEAITAFVDAHHFPLAEGRNVTFVYRGAAHAVYLRHWIYGLPSTQPFDRLGDTDLWYLVQELPEGSRVEYKLEIQEGRRRRLIEDPLNEERAYDPFGANSVARGAGYQVPEWTEPDPEAASGTLEPRRFLSHVLGDTRELTLYLPPGYRETRRYPLIIVHDGPDYLRYARLKQVLDNLIDRLEIPRMLVAMHQPVQRMTEYADDHVHAQFIAEELLPFLEKNYPIDSGPRGRCLMGASFGAVAALGIAYRYPGLFGRLLLQSGSFAFSDIGKHQRGPVFDPVVTFMNEFRANPQSVSEKVFMSCGVYESLIYENRSMVPLIQAAGMELRYVEARDGHNWENWRDRLREGLSWLFPGPLWMVYR